MNCPTDSDGDYGLLLSYLGSSTGLERDQLDHLVREVVAFFGETVESFAARRHADLKRTGLRNGAIFEQIVAELGGHRFAAPALSIRQIRRMIYG